MTESGNPSGIISQEVCLYDSNGNEVVDGHGKLKTIPTVRLVGKSFSGSVKDANFWTESVTGTGSVSIAGEASLKTGETADSTVAYVSNHKARKVSNAHNFFRCLARLTTDPEQGNLRRVGAYDDDNGYFIEINNLTFSVGYRNPTDGDVLISSGNFNGHLGASVKLDTNIVELAIDYHHSEVTFYFGHILLHTFHCETCILVHTGNLPITMENINSGGLDTDHEFVVREASISRLGEIETTPVFAHIVATTAATVLKRGSGILHRIINNDNVGTVTLYDNIEASGTTICILDTIKVLGSIEFGVHFSNGLTVKTTGDAKVTIVYE